MKIEKETTISRDEVYDILLTHLGIKKEDANITINFIMIEKEGGDPRDNNTYPEIKYITFKETLLDEN